MNMNIVVTLVMCLLAIIMILQVFTLVAIRDSIREQRQAIDVVARGFGNLSPDRQDDKNELR